MDKGKHQWVNFTRGRVRLLGCVCCGQMQLPSNIESACPQTPLAAGVLIRNGYRCESSPMLTASM
ncbi:hypothetical protein [Permianibacter aggregans]|uniref:Uncharacterized protein n=1 Tax=Permianibacter aggregans TaxID=1510150 RepID=A0A4R6UM51_9GAMM|nr:hypothetical protein [Permianibacter aggregans]QGX40618.1 hypothetical protein E2H98_13445 [Permianibacter aggregans]TDQ46483.1 hypothetical protein EV696_11324 [Permianibacter aggregans]